MHKYDLEEKKVKAIHELRSVAKKIGKTPTFVEYKRESPGIGSDAIVGLFGSWNDAVRKAGLEINPTLEPPSNAYSEEEIVGELIRVANLCGKFPSHPKFGSLSTMSRGPVERHFGSWVKAKEFIFSKHRNKLNFEPKKTTGKVRRLADKALGISCALASTPRNEMETLVLFSILAEEMGYRILSAQAEYPDLVVEKEGKQKNLEAEFLSSNYLNHGHPINEGTICLCWRKDKDIEGVEIIDLETYIRRRPNKANSADAKKRRG